MKCPKCNTENPVNHKFCSECATPLESDVVHTKTLETPTEELKRGSVFAGRYEVIEELGKGGMGRVYRVEDTKIRKEIALKLIKPEIASDKKTIERFKNELTTAREIAHRNVCRMFDLGEDKGQHYITMEYVPGGDLKRLIRRTKRLDIGTAISIAKQICDGLEEAHSLGIVHRDLKPNNIMIDDNGNARIMDFGIARTIKEKGITGSGVIIGTPEYMSPEQTEAKRVDLQSDIYSLGIIMYEMLTGRLPFEADTPFAVGVKQKSETPEAPKNLNPQIMDDLNGVILQCLEKNKENRPKSVRDVRTELIKIEQSLPTTNSVSPKKKTATSKEIAITVTFKRFIIPIVVIAAVLIVFILMIWSPWSKKTGAPAFSGKPSIAVLPFDDLSPNKDQEPFCDGLSEALIRALSSLSNLQIRGKDSSFFFKGKDQETKIIGEKLDVQYLLQGSLQKAGNTIRVIPRLIDVSEDSVLWSDNYDGELEDTFAFQDKIALAVVEKLRVKLLDGERNALTDHPTDNIEALQFYQMGRYFRYKQPHTADSIFQAKDYYEKAIEKDPNFSAAYAQLAESLFMLRGLGMLPWETWPETVEKVRENAQRALEIDPLSSEAHSTQGVIVEIFDQNWEGAERDFKRAIELNANNFGAHWEYALLLMRTLRFKKAEEECLKALEIDPLSTSALDYLARIYDYMKLKDRAEEIRAKRYEISPPDQEEINPIEAAEADMARFGRNPQFIYNQGIYYAELGDEIEAGKKIAELRELYESHKLDSTAFVIARIYNVLGNKDVTLDWLEKSSDNDDTALMYILTDNWMESVRSDPRFREILKNLKLDKYLYN